LPPAERKADIQLPGSIVDAHYHVWDPARRRYEWLEAAPVELRRRFDLEDFAAASAGSGVAGSVLVQALGDRDETEALLGLSSTSPLVSGVVGWIDLVASDVADQLSLLRERPDGAALVGIRHLVQDEPDARWLERRDVIRGLRAVADAGLAFDLLVRPGELPSAIAAVDAVENGRFVLDHGGKPEISDAVTEPWSRLVGELASRPHVVAKLSGLVTEAGSSWTAKAIAPYVDRLLECFGPGRLLFGSDWPVCTTVASYSEVVGLARSLLRERLAPDEVEMVMTTNALGAYRLQVEGL
jgi:L-fuconolactonase